MAFLPGTRCHRVQIIYFFRIQVGPRTPSGTGLGSGSRLDRMRWFLGLPSEWALDPKLIGLGLEARALPSTLLDMYRLIGHKGLDKRGNRPRLLKLLWDLKVSTLESPDSSDEEGGETLDEMRERKAKEKLDADLDKLDAAECVANALLEEQTQPTDELVQCARADEAAVRGADDVTERRADQRLPPLAAYVHPQRVRHAPTFGYDKFLRK